MENERIKEVLIEFLDLMRNDSTNSYTRGIINDLKKKLNQPEEPQGYQGLNKWYLTKGGHIIYAKSINEFNCYGIRVKNDFNYLTHWYNDFALQYDNISRLATPSEIQSAILKGCEQKGIVKGAKVRCLTCHNDVKEITDDFVYHPQFNTLTVSVIDENMIVSRFKVFDNGKFAEVVKEADKWKNVINGLDNEAKHYESKVVERGAGWEIRSREPKETKPSDKELLKECKDFLGKVRGLWSDSSPRGSEITELLTKLNKHLNHE